MYLNRTLCDVLREMRDLLEPLDKINIDKYKSITKMLIEEAQSMGNRMEAALSDIRDINTLHERRKELKQAVKALKKQKTKLDGVSNTAENTFSMLEDL